MSGHSKWHNIRLRKGKQDAERGKLFTKVAREIIVAAKEGGSNPDTNLRLRLAVQKARENSMPAENIKRALQRGSGELEGVNYEEVTYEGYGPAGVAVLVSCLTENRNRTVAELRVAFSRNGGSLGESGCVSWMFDQKGLITIGKSTIDEDTLMLTALDAGAEDIQSDDESYEITCAPNSLNGLRQALTDAGIKFESAELTMIPQTTIKIETVKEASQIIRMMDQIEDSDDVQQVHANFDIPEEILEAVAAG
ncbi:YebC/PmpR family DNA-binding transcriptional regulator [uncultured Desulfobulbus sp.]|uniref:YebC/PmpR family DNA-binding transcriptional regulator n=1 Tax=uncultured Desulfobulbus sp. TaxID=239745 RepID=UPI0029C9899C|nr:YebC/PmpR family DNA-binding transcriptional regulator [uncultured Desulfobulbus sp.]